MDPSALEAVLMAADEPVSLKQLSLIFAPTSREMIVQALETLSQHYTDRGIELKKLATGYRFQTRDRYAPWVSKLWEEKSPKYSRAFLETVAIIAYRQPITRAEIEAIRGVAVSSSIIKTLMDLSWVRVEGYRDVPGKPALLGTTSTFLDYFNLSHIKQLPELLLHE